MKIIFERNLKIMKKAKLFHPQNINNRQIKNFKTLCEENFKKDKKDLKEFLQNNKEEFCNLLLNCNFENNNIKIKIK